MLSENYFQYADHFTRVQNEQESIRMAKINSSSTVTEKSGETKINDEKSVKSEDEVVKKIASESTVKKDLKSSEKKILEKKSAAS